MFSYIRPSVRARLEDSAHLVCIDRQGRPVPVDDASAHLSMLGPIPIPRRMAQGAVLFDWYPFVRRTELGAVMQIVRSPDAGMLRELLESSMTVNSVLALPGFRASSMPLVRLRSCCLTGDVFGSRRCDCGPQLARAFDLLVAAGDGAVVYMAGHEGRGIGLWAKAVTYLLQDEGHDTFEANAALGLPDDSRDFADAAIALRYLRRERAIRLLSNNPDKRAQLERGGQPVSELVPLLAGACVHNARYLRAKRGRGHTIPHDGLPTPADG
jgi:GTP cyclohydrolase II